MLYLTEFEREVLNQLRRIRKDLQRILRKEQEMALDLSDLQSAVSQEQGVQQSVIVLLQQLTAEVEANAGDPVALAAVVQTIRDNTDALAAAVQENTPPAPPAG